MKRPENMGPRERYLYRVLLNEKDKNLCGKCLKVKPKSAFYNCKSIWNGVTNSCKDCTAINNTVTNSRRKHNRDLLQRKA